MGRRSVFSAEDEQTEINLSPMIDCIFILLIFFIVTTVFVEEKGLQVHKPDAAATANLDIDENITLEITDANAVMFAGEQIHVKDIPMRVRTSMQGEDIPVIIRAHEEADHGIFVAVWDAAARGGAKSMSFSTVN